MLERNLLKGQHHDFSVSKAHYLYPTSGSYYSLILSFMGIFGRDRGDGLPPLAVHEHPARKADPNWLSNDSYLPDHAFRPGRHRAIFGLKHFAQLPHEKCPHEGRN